MERLGNAVRGGAYLVQLFGVVLAWCLGLAAAASALEPADVALRAPRIDLAPYFVRVESDAREVNVPMPKAAGDGEILRLKAVGSGPHFVWLVAALANRSNVAQSDILELPGRGFTGSGLVWPQPLGGNPPSASVAGPASLAPAAGAGGRAWQLDLAPGKTAALVIETDGAAPAAISLWQRAAFESNTTYTAFFRGALLGIAMLLCLALFALYGLRHRAVYMAAGCLALTSFGFMLIESGHLAIAFASFGLSGWAIDVARAAVEAAMAATLLVFIVASTELRNNLPLAGNLLMIIAALSLALPVYAFAEPLIASGMARMVFGAAAVAGFAIAFAQWQRGNERVDAGLASCAGVLLWSFLALVVAISGGASTVLSPVLLAGLAAVLAIMTFALAHQAFAQGYLAPHLFRDAGRRALALAGARAYVWDWQAEFGHLHLAEEFDEALGLQPGVLAEIGVDGFLELMHPVDRAAYIAAVDAAERQGSGPVDCEFRLRHGDGGYRWFELRGRAMRGHGRRAARCIGTMTDITATKLAEERLLADAVYDVVTGLPNRALFIDRLARATALALPGDPDGVYVLLLDIDRFKTMNEALGHERGDALLTVIGRRLSVEMAPADTVARMPGDQFAVLYAGHASRDIAAFAEALLKAVARPINLDGQEVFLTACIGIAQYREPGLTGEQMLKDAAIALYEAKRHGSSGIEVFDVSMRDERAELVVLESELRRAIERNEIEVHYQPIARLADMNLAGFEALVRWRHPSLGLLMPESFISLAEQTGMIRDIGLAVLDEAGRQLGIWQRTFMPAEPLFVAVNISSAQLLETDLIDDIKLLLHREGVRRESLKIEITESLVMQYPERAGQILDRIRELGVGLACDDFGTGYSSLSSLRKLPFDTLKVDRSFIMPDSADERAAIILEAIVALGHALNLTIVAEGIENQEQVDRLGLLGCDLGQGYFIGKALTAQQVSDALAGLPYAVSNGRTAITWLWERASRDPAPEPQPLVMTADSVIEAKNREAAARRDRDRQIADRLNAERLAMLRYGSEKRRLAVQPSPASRTPADAETFSSGPAAAQPGTSEQEAGQPSPDIDLDLLPKFTREPQPDAEDHETGEAADHDAEPHSDLGEDVSSGDASSAQTPELKTGRKTRLRKRGRASPANTGKTA